jgi:hypothetical protein
MHGTVSGGPGVCGECGTSTWVVPLHGPKGGPPRCFMCAGAWNAKHTRRRKWGRIIVKAMKMYEKEGGAWRDFDKMKLAASPFPFSAFPEFEADTIGTEVGDITAELLADTLQLTHPDRHPPERRELAQRVTQELLALKPFVFPAPKPEPPKPMPPQEPRDASVKDVRQTLKDLSRYPCEDCATEVPRDYCDACRAEWEKRQAADLDRERKKVREQYARRRARRKKWQKPVLCAACGTKVEANRRDAKFCSPACRQKHHRQHKGVTAPSSLDENIKGAVTPKRRNVWKLEERDGDLWRGNIKLTRGCRTADSPRGSYNWHYGVWRVDHQAIQLLWEDIPRFFSPIHRCCDCEGWILAHPHTLRCNECHQPLVVEPATACPQEHVA